MAMKMLLAVALMVVFSGVMGGASAQSLCNLNQGDIQLCLPAFQGSPPSPQCCGAIRRADIPCFCSLRKTFLAPSLGINPELATSLPAKCGLPPLVCR